MTMVLHGVGLGKRYRGGDGTWSLRDVNLSVNAGEIVAVIGRNGAGKSTLLKVVSGVTVPSEGQLSRARRVAPLIEVGAGFHPELTGRENVSVNARLLGMSSREIRARFDDIVEFAELAHVIDRPVKDYSSGMYMRLGFAVAVHTSPELLLVDEVLAVGDLPFQVKCLDRIKLLREEGAGVLFVSHNLAAVLGLASRAMLIDGGRVLDEGDPRSVVGSYHALLAASGRRIDVMSDDAVATAELEVLDLTVTDVTGAGRDLWSPGDRARITFRLRAGRDLPEGMVGIRLSREGAGVVGGWMSNDGPFLPAMVAGEEHTVTLELGLFVSEGTYHLDLAVAQRDMQSILYNADGVYRFGVAARQGGSGIVDLDPMLYVDEHVGEPVP
jgi:ABC-type polysaccharide/polyol phosphate transport system ATPase subunit